MSITGRFTPYHYLFSDFEVPMGRTLPSITQSFLTEEESFGRFRRALRRSDQLALDELFNAARQHLAAAAYAALAVDLLGYLARRYPL